MSDPQFKNDVRDILVQIDYARTSLATLKGDLYRMSTDLSDKMTRMENIIQKAIERTDEAKYDLIEACKRRAVRLEDKAKL